MLRERNQSFKIMFISMDLMLSLLAFCSASLLHFFVLARHQRFRIPSDTGGNFPLAAWVPESFQPIMMYAFLGILVAGCQVVAMIAIDLYHPRRGLRPFREVAAISRGILLGLIVTLALLFFYRGASYSRMVILYSSIFSSVYITLGHLIFRYIMGRLRTRGFNTRSVLIIGAGPNALRLYQTLARHAIYGYRVLGVISSKKDALPELRDLIKGNLRNFASVARRLDPDMIVYALPHEKDTVDNLQSVLDFCDSEGTDLRIVPHMVELITARSRVEDMDGMPLLTIRDTPLKNGYNRFLKRSFDFAFAITALLLLSPVLITIALLVKFTSPGPIFFNQERVGLDRKLFKVFKFRSMVVQTSSRSDTTWGSFSDARVTPLGKFIRKSSLDELPQFINVLLGSMSVVGPRPERPHFVEQFKNQYEHYMHRHAAKAGITGWAQIQGLRGDTSIRKRLRADIYYIENWSIWFDIFIILKTIPSMAFNPGE